MLSMCTTEVSSSLFSKEVGSRAVKLGARLNGALEIK